MNAHDRLMALAMAYEKHGNDTLAEEAAQLAGYVATLEEDNAVLSRQVDQLREQLEKLQVYA